MIIENKLKQILTNNQNLENKLFLRTLLKEVIQDYILTFIYNSQTFKKLIFTGGTCLRKVYGLPRLSEDLDFDFTSNLNLVNFGAEIKEYFVANLQYKNLEIKIGNQEKTIFFKLPILKDLGLVRTGADSPLLFVRCDFSKEETKIFKTEVNPISTDEFSFFCLSYDLPTLLANKIVAILERDFFKGKNQLIPFKGRDIFDFLWLLEKSAKTDSFKPNWQRVYKRLKTENKEEILKKLLAKLEKVDKEAVYNDLIPFVKEVENLKNFRENFLEAIKNKIKFL